MRPRRLAFYAFLLVLAGSVAAVVYEYLLNAVRSYALTEDLSRMDAVFSLTYRLEDDRWHVFDLPARHGEVKILTNGFVDVSVEPQENIAARYRMDYEIRGSGGSVLRKGSHHFRTKIRAQTEEDRLLKKQRFHFDEPGLKPLAGRMMILDTLDLTRATKEVALRLGTSDDILRGVVVRIYYKRLLTTAQKSFRWKRLSAGQRRRIARYNVYSPDLLDEREREKYAAFEWVAAAPRGVLNEDYDVKVLYDERPEEDDTGLDQEPPGRLVRSGRRLVVGLPAGQHRVELEFTRIGEITKARLPAEVWIAWRGGDPERIQTFRRVIAGEKESFSGWLEEGVLELEPSESLFVRCFLRLGEVREEVAPCDYRVRAFLCDRGDTLVLGTENAAGTRNPYRIDVRRILPVAEGAGVNSAEYQVVVRQAFEPGRDVEPSEAEIHLEGILEVSPRTELSSEEQRLVSRPGRHYFYASPDARAIELCSELDGTLVTVYNRIDAAERKVQVPSSSDPCDQDGRDWHLVFPRNLAEWEARQKVKSLEIQPASAWGSAADDPVYPTWRHVAAVWPARSEELLSPSSSEPDASDLAGAGYFLEVPLYRILPVLVRGGLAAGEKVRPRLIVDRDAAEVGGLQVDIDGQTVFLIGPGESVERSFHLPPILQGQHTLRVGSPHPGGRIFISSVYCDVGDLYRQWSATPLEEGLIRYELAKRTEGPELLLGRLFLEESVTEPVELCVDLRLPGEKETGPFRSWTFPRQHITVLPVGEPRALLLRGCALREPHIFRVQLNEDLRPGPYLLEVRCAAGLRGYLRLSQGEKVPPPDGKVTRWVSVERSGLQEVEHGEADGDE